VTAPRAGSSASTTSLDPRSWPDDEVDHILQASSAMRSLDSASATYAHALIVGSTGRFAQYAGRKALEAGGSAADAALVTAFTQVALAHGGWVSYAGIMSVVHYDAATGKITSLSGGFGTFKGETDPSSIPAAPTPSGRSALVPGYFKAAEELHRRHGKLAWADLLLPAIHVAEVGFVVGPERMPIYDLKRDVVLRTPEGREQFTFDGGYVDEDTRITQPQLAGTLRRVAAEGADHIYRGAWAQRFVEIVQREGGNVTIDDLNNYEAIWSQPITAEFNGYTLHGVGVPDTGGAALAESLQIVELADLGDITSEGESLHRLLSIMRTATQFTGLPPAMRTTRSHAEKLWKEIQNAGGPVGPGVYSSGSHSDYVVSVDGDGNVVAMCHSINTSMWGSTGIFVDGISIPDSACFQQQPLTLVTPGDHLPHPMNPAIFTRDGVPVLASSSIGSGLMETTLQCLVTTLRDGRSVAESAAQPLIHNLDFISGDSVTSAIEDAEEDALASGISRMQRFMQEELEKGTPQEELYGRFMATMPQVLEDGFDEDLVQDVRDRGIDVVRKPIDDPTLPRGYWVGVWIDPVTGHKTGARTPYCTGLVEGI